MTPEEALAAARAGAPVTRTLLKPIPVTFNAGKPDERVEQVTELTMRTDVVAGDLLVMDEHEGDTAKTLAMVAHLTDQPFAVIKRLKKDDFAFLASLLDEL